MNGARTAAARRGGRAAAAILLTGSLLGCRAPRGAPDAVGAARPDAAPADANARLDELIREHVDASLAASPITATWLGAHTADDRLDDLSPGEQARQLARLYRTLDRLDGIAATSLDEGHRLDRDLLARDLRLRLFDQTELRPLERSPIRYLDLLSSAIFELLAKDFAPLPDRLRSVTARLGRVRPFFDEARRNLKNPPELHTRKAIELCQGTRSFVAEILPRLVNAVGDERLLADFRSAQGDALRALDDFLAWLQRDLLPRSHGEFALGRERLVERLRLAERIDLSGDALSGALLTAAEHELKAAMKRFEEAARQVAPGKSPMDAFRSLEEDHPAAEQLVPSVVATLDQIHAFAVERKLLAPPEPLPKVTEMPPYLWGFLLAAFPGPLEARQNPLLYVDPVNKSWDRRTREEHLRALNRPQIALTVAHEVLGHFVQVEAARHAPSLIERVADDDAFGQGWAAYVDQVVADEGFHAPPEPAQAGTAIGRAPSEGRDASATAAASGTATAAAGAASHGELRLRLAQRREALILLCRLVAALRVHAADGKIDDAVEIFTDECYLEDSVARREAERVAYDPAVLDAGLGMLSLLRLRDDVQRAEGDGFTPARFHGRLLAHGALPLGLARKLLLPNQPAVLF